MDENERSELIAMGWKIHAAVEASGFRHAAAGADGVAPAHAQERQRMLLADMAIHLLQTAIAPGALDLDRLQDNLHAIVTVGNKFLPPGPVEEGSSS